MAEVNIKTRLSLRYDTLANWNSANPVLNKGEVAVVAIPSGAAGESTYGQDTKPSILFKVGDGTSNFKALPYASARAADVYAWAKASSKPSYSATEISFSNGGDSDLTSTTVGAALTELRNKDAEINQTLNNLSGNVYTKSETYTKAEVDKAIDDAAKEIQDSLESDTNTKYQIVFDSTNGLLKLQSKEIGESSWTDVSGQSFDLTTLTVAKAKGISTETVASGSGQTFKMPLINADGNFVEGASEYSMLGKGITVEKGSLKPIIDADIKGNAATATTSLSATSAEAAKKDNKGNVIDETYATKAELQPVASTVQKLDGYFTSDGKAIEAVKAIKDGSDNVIVDTYATKTELSGLSSELDSHIATVGPQIAALQGKFTEDSAKKAIADKNGNDITTTYATKTELSGLDYESVGAAAASHTHTKSEITDFAHSHFASEVNYVGNNISAASGKTIQVAVDTVYDTAIGANNALTLHKNDNENPHGVTAAQVGAYAKSETYSKNEVDGAISTSSEAITDGLADGTIQVHSAERATMDGSGQTITSTYATKSELNSLSSTVTGIQDGNVTVKKAEQDASGNVITSTYATKSEMNNIAAIANGKTKTYVLSYTPTDSSCNGNGLFNSNNDTISLTQSSKTQLVDGTILSNTGLKVGDIFLVKETDVPDRWVMSVNGSGTFTLAKMETSKVDLSSYYTKDETDTKLDDKVSKTEFNNQIKRVEPAKVYVTMPTAVGSSSSIPTEGSGKIAEWLNRLDSTVPGNSYPEIELVLYDAQTSGKVIARPVYVSQGNGKIIAEARLITAPGLVRIYLFEIGSSSIKLTDIRTELLSVTGSNGVKVTTSSDGIATASIDTDTVFVLNGGDAAGAYNF